MAHVPFAHLVAEIAAFPFASEAAFRGAVSRLGASMDPATAALWRELETELAGRAGGNSLDSLVGIRDALWFGPPSEMEGELGHVLRRLAGLSRINDDRRPHGPHDRTTVNGFDGLSVLGDHPHVIDRWLTFAMPPELISCAASGRRHDAADGTYLFERTLRDAGLTEVHLHLGAACSFDLLWASTMTALATSPLSKLNLASPGAPFENGAGLRSWLLTAAIGRLLFAQSMVRGARLAEWVASGMTGSSSADRIVASQVLMDLWSPGDRPRVPDAEMQSLYRSLAAIHGRPSPDSIDAAFEGCDPIARLCPANGGMSPDMRWTAAILDRLESMDQSSALLFWQLVRIRCIFYRHIVQRPMTSGLQWFTRHYARIGPVRAPIESVLLDGAVELCRGGVGGRVASLEVRASPGCNPSEVKAFFRQCLRAWERISPGLDGAELALVLHFVKRREGGWPDGSPKAHWRGTTAVPDGRSARFERYFRGLRGQARALATVVQQIPAVLWYFRGIDVATDELAVPTWVIAPLFRHLRTVADSAVEHSPTPYRPPDGLRATAHCGEDFVHLLGGLRRIWEAAVYLCNRIGDRLGHATALGVDPARWQQRTRTVMMPLEERVLDLAWEWDVRTAHGLSSMPGRIESLERELRALAHELFGEEVQLHHLAEATRSLNECLELDGWDVACRPRGLHCREGVRAALMNSANVFARGRRVISVDVDRSETHSLAALSEWLRGRINDWGLTVEVNPSSNLLIADLGDLAEHPVVRLRPPPIDLGQPGTSVPVAIGSDDPLTFATSLPNEYRLLFESLRRCATDAASLEKWLDGIRLDSHAARFSFPSTQAAPHLQHVLRELG